jgi:hypothetical protein
MGKAESEWLKKKELKEQPPDLTVSAINEALNDKNRVAQSLWLKKRGLVRAKLGDTVSYQYEATGEWILEDEARSLGITHSSRPTKNKKTKKK